MVKSLSNGDACAPRMGNGGMALVVVLGLITLLIISSVAFVINMRIERAGAANVRNTTMAHEAAKGALAYAIAAIDKDVGSKNYAAWDDWDERTRNGEPGRLCPYWDYHTGTDYSRPGADTGSYRLLRFWKDTFGSADHLLGGVDGNKNDALRRAPAKIVNAKIGRFIPPGARLRSYARRYQANGTGDFFPSADEDVIAPEWVPLTSDPTNQNVVGRYAFLAFDTSGYLDLTAVCKEGDDAVRGFGGSASEIQPVSALLNANVRGNTAASRQAAVKNFKKNNKGIPYETVAEIASFSKNRDSKNSSRDGKVFDDGAAFKAFSYNPIERIPADDLPATLPANFPFRNKICIAGDGSEEKHIKYLRKHRAAIIKAFALSGLTQTSDFSLPRDLVDDACSDEKCPVCGGTAPSYRLPRSEAKEQAVWAYLGLLDYCDDDDDPAYDEGLGVSKELQQFARPVVEPAPLFNGFMATIRFYVQEKGKRMNVGDEANPNYKTVFDKDKFIAGVEFNGKVVFANRCAAEPGTVTFDDIQNDEMDARMGLYFDGELWEMFQDRIDALGVNARDHGIERNPLQLDGDGLYMEKKGAYFMDGPMTFFLPVVTNEFQYKNGPLVDPEQPSEQKDKYFPAFPTEIAVCAAGQSYNQAGNIAHRFPALEDSYEYFYSLDGPWLISYFNSGDEGRSFKHSQHNPQFYEEELEAVYSTATKAAEGGAPDYKLKRRVVNIVMWAEPLDPAFSCGAMAELPGSIDTGNNDFDPKAVFASHNAMNGSSWKEFSLAHADNYSELSGFSGADKFKIMMELNQNGNAKFKGFAADFTNDPDYFDGYFRTSVDDTDDYQTGYSAFQRFFLKSEDAQDEFGGVIDGSRHTASGFSADEALDQFNSAYARGRENSGEPGLDSPGELGFLPVGPFATIRLFGYTQEEGFDKDNIKPESSLFNQVADGSPYHRVLDLFSGKTTRGRVNLGSSDMLAISSIFNGIPLDDFAGDSPADATKRIGEDDAVRTIAPALIDTIANAGFGTARLKLSDMCRLFDGPYSDDLDAALGNSGFEGNLAREALIRNSCGLFTTRGLDFIVVMRGEAFTPFFGKTDVKSELGTTLASRMAIAQVWRDTEPDENGKYPVFVHYFKIFDD